MLDFNSVYLRLVAYAATFFAGLIPAWLVGQLTVSPAGLFHIDFAGVSVAAVTAIVLSLAIFKKWGIKPDFFTGSDLWGSYLRVLMYSVTSLVGMLPAKIGATVVFDAVGYGMTVDLPALGIALLGGAGVNLGVFAIWGLKPPAVT